MKTKKLFKDLFRVAKAIEVPFGANTPVAPPEMNTVMQPTGTVLDGGKAVKLDHHTRIVYSKEIEYKALPNMRFLQFAKIKTELGVQPGLEIQMMTYNNLKKGGALTEGVRMQSQGLRASMKAIRVGERGNAVTVSELSLQTSFRPIMADATTLLSRDVAVTLDVELRDVALRAPNVIYGRVNKAQAKITTRDDITATNVMSVTAIKDAVEILATNNTPKIDGAYYICFVHPHQSRDLRDDSAWINASNYGAPEHLFNGEIGRIDDVRFIETTMMCNGAVGTEDLAYKAGLTSTDGTEVFQSVLFGEDLYGYAVALPVELRDNGVIDFGREHGLAWYAIWGADLLHPERGVVIETA